MLIAYFGNREFGHGQVVVNIVAFFLYHPLVGRFSESLFKQTAEGRRAVAAQLRERFHIFYFRIVLHDEIPETFTIPVNRGIESSQVLDRIIAIEQVHEFHPLGVQETGA